jgi:hypothetical protein
MGSSRIAAANACKVLLPENRPFQVALFTGNDCQRYGSSV